MGTSEQRENSSIFEGVDKDELESRIGPCIIDYRKEKKRSPKIVILSDNARTYLLHAGLLKKQNAQGRDILNVTLLELNPRYPDITEKEFKLEVYTLRELSGNTMLKVHRYFQQHPGTFYIGSKTLFRKVKESSLENYNLAASSTSLSQM